jgi:hypothetical protein
MTTLTDLPTEILLIIISHLKIIPSTTKESLRDQNRKAILPLTTNRKLWKIARPFLYEDIELLFSTVDEKEYEVKQRTSLLIRTLQKDPSLKFHVRTLKVKGFLYNPWGYWRDGLAKYAPARHNFSSVRINTAELADLLTSFVGTRIFKVVTPYGLHTDINHASNQTLVHCMRAMTMLHTLEITAGNLIADEFKKYPNPIIYLLNAASNKLNSLSILPAYGEQPIRGFQKFPDYSNPAPTPKSQLSSLSIPGHNIPLSAIRPWLISGLKTFNISQLLILDGQINEGMTLKGILTPMASTLRDFRLSVEFNGEPPLLSDLALVELPLLESFEYFGPWFFRPDHQPVEICETLLAKSYRFLKLQFGANTPGQEVTLQAIKYLRAAFRLAHDQGFSPKQCILTVLMDSTSLYSYNEDFRNKVREELNGLRQEMTDRGAEIARFVIFPEDKTQIIEVPESEEEEEQDIEDPWDYPLDGEDD